jgi:cell division protein FtsI/penicillin-binding protein 2
VSRRESFPPFVRMRAFFACGLLMAGLGGIAVRLFYLQVLCEASYRRQARRFVSSVRQEEVRRASIFSANGVLLAASFHGPRAPATLAIDWEFLKQNRRRDFSVATLVELGAILGVSPGDLLADLRAAVRAEENERGLHWLPVRVRPGLGRPRTARLAPGAAERVAAYVRLHQPLRGVPWKQGVILDVDHGRHYTFRGRHEPSWRYHGLCREIVGAVDAYGDGMVGAEGAFDALLRGEPGLVEEQQGAVKDFLRRRMDRGVGVRAVEPAHVYLTIDTRLQKIALDAVRDEVERQGTLKGAVLIMEPATGRILACVTWPRQKSPEAIFTYYEPGSVFKALVAAEALIEGKVRRGGPVLWKGGGSRWIPGRGKPVVDAHPGENLTFEDGFILSSNIVFSLVGDRLGSAGMRRLLRRFALLEGPAVAHQLWPARARGGAGFKPWVGEHWGPDLKIGRHDVTSLSWGNALHVSCLTLARGYASLVNGGYLVEPSILRGLERPRSGYREVPPRRKRIIHNPAVLETMTYLLRRVVEDEHGTAHRLAIPGLSFGAKTGTAKKDRGGYDHDDYYTGGFIAHAPAVSPRYVIVAKVDVDRNRLKNRRLYYGSWTAGPIVKRILEALYRGHVE